MCVRERRQNALVQFTRTILPGKVLATTLQNTTGNVSQKWQTKITTRNKVVDFLSSAEKITKTPKYHANPFSLKADTTTDAKHKSGENIRDVQYLHTEGQHEAFCSVTMSRRRVMFLVHCVPRRGKKYNHS